MKRRAGWLTLVAGAAVSGCGGPPFSAGAGDGGHGDGGLVSDSSLADGGGGSDVISRDGLVDVVQTDGPAQVCNCHPAPPAGWSGPGEAHQGLVGHTVPSCGPAFVQAVMGNEGFMSPMNDCACACDSATGQSCSGPLVAQYFSNTACTLSLGMSQTLTGMCAQVGTPLGAALTVTPPAPTGGSCVAMPAMPAPYSWTATDSVCALATVREGSCGTGNVCFPNQDVEFPAVCIWQGGLVATCPTEYPNMRTTFANVSDTRSCGPCQCGAPGGATCTVTVGLGHSLANCNQTSTTSAACIQLSGATDIVAVQTLSGTGTCQASGGGVSGGSLTPTTATTLCCTP